MLESASPASIVCILASAVLLLAAAPDAATREYRDEELSRFAARYAEARKARDDPRARALVAQDPALAERVANGMGAKARESFRGGDLETARHWFIATLTLFQDLGDKRGIAVASSDLAVVHEREKHCKLALRDFARAARLARELGDARLRDSAVNGIGMCIFQVMRPVQNLGGIANLSVSKSGEQEVIVDPERCKQAGVEVCGFYAVHEYAHVYLEHATYGVAAVKGEPDADCWAARNVPAEWVEATYRWLLSGQPSPAVHGSSALRAQRIRRCARK